MEKKDVQVGVRMSSTLREKLQLLADRDKRKLASYIVTVLEAHVEEVQIAARKN